jgi:hypothetical protein
MHKTCPAHFIIPHLVTWTMWSLLLYVLCSCEDNQYKEVGNMRDKQSAIFWDVTLCSRAEVNRCILEECNASIFRVQEHAKQEISSCLAYSSTLKIQVECSSRTLINFWQNKQCHTPKHSTLQNHHCKNLKPKCGKIHHEFF